MEKCLKVGGCHFKLGFVTQLRVTFLSTATRNVTKGMPLPLKHLRIEFRGETTGLKGNSFVPHSDNLHPDPLFRYINVDLSSIKTT